MTYYGARMPQVKWLLRKYCASLAWISKYCAKCRKPSQFVVLDVIDRGSTAP